MGSERGLAAPRAVKKEIIEKMAKAVESSLKDTEFLKIAEQQKLPLAYLSADQWTPLVQGDAKWLEEVWKETPWR
jgi:tripartite-type tricarboxylate transporter receptor subunit TctC